jgi:hypothetical protein
MRLRQVILFIVVLVLAVTELSAAQADVLSWLSKGSKVGRAGSVVGGAALRSLSREETLILAGSAAVFIDMRGPHVIFEGLSKGGQSIADATGDIAQAARRFFDEVGDAGTQPLATQRYVMTRETAKALDNKIDDLANEGLVSVIERGWGAVPVRVLPLGEGTLGRFRELRPGLVVRLNEDLTQEAVELLQSTVERERIRVVSFFDANDVATVRRLAETAGNRLVDGQSLVGAQGKVRSPFRKGDIIIAVGHVEGRDFVVRSAVGNVSYRVTIAEVEEAADRAGATLLSAGCNCFTASSRGGFLGPVTDAEVALSVSEALNAKSYADMLAAFGRSDTPYVITNRALAKLSEQRVLELERLTRHSHSVNVGAVALRLTRLVQSEPRMPVQSEPRMPNIMEGIITGVLPFMERIITGVLPFMERIITGVLPFLFMFRRNRNAYIRLFPVEPNSRLFPVRSLGVRCLREGLFFTFGPVISTLVFVSFLFGGWSARDTLHEFFWSALFRPLHFLTVSGFVILRFGMICMFCVPVVGLILELTLSPSQYRAYLSLVLAIIAVPYFGLAWWMVRRFPDHVADWIGNGNWPACARTAVVLALALMPPLGIGSVAVGTRLLIQETRLPVASPIASKASAHFGCGKYLVAMACQK